jgi:hypothetical protein
MDILLLIALVIVSNILFWGFIIYFVIRIWRSKNLTPEQKAALVAGGMTLASGGRRASSEPGPVESDVRSMAASEGIDLDR